MTEKVDLVTASGGTLAKVMDAATRLGVGHETEGAAIMSKAALAAHFCTGYRKFHATALKAAYTAGRSHVSCMGRD